MRRTGVVPRRVHLPDEFVVVARFCPNFPRFERDEHIGLRRKHRVGGDFGASDAGDDGVCFVGKLALERPFQQCRALDWGFERHGRRIRHANRNRAFVQLRQKLRLQMWKQTRAQDEENRRAPNLPKAKCEGNYC